MTLFNVKLSLSLRILGLDHYQFSCSRQAFAYVISRNSPFDLIHLFTRALLNSHWFLPLKWKPFLSCLLDHRISHTFLMTSFPTYETMHKHTIVSFTIPLLVILNTTYFNKLHLDIGVNSSSLTHISIHMIIVACYYFITRPWRGIHLVIWALSWTLIHFVTYITNMIIISCSYTQQDG